MYQRLERLSWVQSSNALNNFKSHLGSRGQTGTLPDPVPHVWGSSRNLQSPWWTAPAPPEIHTRQNRSSTWPKRIHIILRLIVLSPILTLNFPFKQIHCLGMAESSNQPTNLTCESLCFDAIAWSSSNAWLTCFSSSNACCMASSPVPHSSRCGFCHKSQTAVWNMH